LFVNFFFPIGDENSISLCVAKRANKGYKTQFSVFSWTSLFFFFFFSVQ
jgi:hypothetical protein